MLPTTPSSLPLTVISEAVGAPLHSIRTSICNATGLASVRERVIGIIITIVFNVFLCSVVNVFDRQRAACMCGVSMWIYNLCFS